MPRWDRDELDEQYAESDNLDARIALHANYSTAETDLHRWLFERYDLPSDADVLELGCGTGRLWVENAERVPAAWTLTLTDRSAGMVEETRTAVSDALADADRDAVDGPDGSDRPGTRFARVDAASVPVDDDSVDAVVANHMLYHVPDRETAYAEIRRVLRPGGRLYAATNGDSHLAELGEYVTEALGEDHEFHSAMAGFTLESAGDELRAQFEDVRVERHPNGLRVPDPEPLVAYAASMTDRSEAEVAALARVAEERTADGPFEARKDTGVFVVQVA